MKVVSSCVNMVWIKANYDVPGAYRKVVTSQAPSFQVHREKLKISMLEGTQSLYAQLPSGKKASGNSSGCPLKILKKKTRFLKKQEAVA